MDEMIRRGEDQTDWERVRALTPEQIEASIDFEDEGVFDWTTVQAEDSPTSQRTIISIDPETMDWFRAKAGDDYQDRINAVLREYVDAEKREAS
ncbi:MAG: hypothetical protein AVDCRST_MAG33-2904 [uncultured Thermomicrobiales bacterium]|uniref:BrnA antitoxin of type II toxin-antitoxin system n=1 Tax=uncultured Thermomicrobiales bacterium TaxID=1645740 RepID=A0A6J4VBH5_9BACT|nr:MAG: hypothetical protein AVDCRST_MAG33-2904 [uncultured Thermomicrobiales bacterium]